MYKTRLPKELLDLQKNPIENITVEAINESDLLNWKVTIKGPNESQYKDQIFNLNISFKNDYPLSFPDFVFTTNIDHPNFHINEKISLNILEIASWTPFISIRTILLKIYSLLINPLINPIPVLAIAPNVTHIHDKFCTDNIQRKITVHFCNFLINFLNEILKNLNIQVRFYRLNYSTIAKKSNLKMIKNINLAEFICNDISLKYRLIPKFYNREIYENLLIQGNEIVINLLNEKCLTIFKEIYCNNTKIINLKKYGLDKQICLSQYTRNLQYLIERIIVDKKYCNCIKKYIEDEYNIKI